eukprot:c17364_g1_i2.p1 GENE.c17364_g1_i2~~c17364_g1_i2.p1  ORF type:complete len:178 (+),score=19.80 c17364_g1_i2:22-534(+)
MMMLHRAGPRALLTVPRTLALRVHTQPSTAPSFDAFKDRLNETMDKYPLASFASWIGINYSVFGFWFGTLYISNFSFGPLAVGFAIGGQLECARVASKHADRCDTPISPPPGYFSRISRRQNISGVGTNQDRQSDANSLRPTEAACDDQVGSRGEQVRWFVAPLTCSLEV